MSPSDLAVHYNADDLLAALCAKLSPEGVAAVVRAAIPFMQGEDKRVRERRLAAERSRRSYEKSHGKKEKPHASESTPNTIEKPSEPHGEPSEPHGSSDGELTVVLPPSPSPAPQVPPSPPSSPTPSPAPSLPPPFTPQTAADGGAEPAAPGEGDVEAARARAAKAEAESQQREAKRQLDAAQTAEMNEIVHRQPRTKWSDKEKKAFHNHFPFDAEALAAVKVYYGDLWPPSRQENHLRHDLLTLLNNWPGEVDRAFRHREQKQNGPQRSKSNIAEPGKTW